MIYHIKRVFQLIIQLATSFFCTIRKDSTNIWMSSLETVQTHTTKMQEGWQFRSTVTKIWDLLPIMSITDPKALVSLSVFTQAFLLPLLQSFILLSPVLCGSHLKRGWNFNVKERKLGVQKVSVFPASPPCEKTHTIQMSDSNSKKI